VLRMLPARAFCEDCDERSLPEKAENALTLLSDGWLLVKGSAASS
jgi:hypothetical protein